MTDFGVIGFGRIGRRLVERISAVSGDAPRLRALLVRPTDARAATAIAGKENICFDLNAFIARRPAVAIECASPAALIATAPRLLAEGVDVMPLSLCAFADPDVETRLLAASRAGPGRLEIPPGAIASLDALATARENDLRRVVFRVSKPEAAWRGTYAEILTDLDAVKGRSLIYKASARVVAATFPNLNVCVAVALAGLGLDCTEVELYVDPSTSQAMFEVEIDAASGMITITVRGRDVPHDTDPIDYSTFSLIRLLRRRAARVAI